MRCRTAIHKWIIPSFFLALIAALPTRSAHAQTGWDQPQAAASDDGKVYNSAGRITDPYEGAMRLLAQGKYTEALKVLKVIAAKVPDSEIALLQIGHCYIGLARSAANADAAQRDIDTGTGWIIHAASLGIRDAQEELVQLYLDGKIFFIDPPEAGKWYYLWKRNRSDVAFGIVEFNPTLEKRLKLALSAADWADAKNRADDWERASYGVPASSSGIRK